MKGCEMSDFEQWAMNSGCHGRASMYSLMNSSSHPAKRRSRAIAVVLGAVLSLAPGAVAQADVAGPNSSAGKFAGQTNGNAAAGNVSKIAMRSLLYPAAKTQVIARVMPWFDGEKHRGPAYRSDDAQQVRNQVADMMSRGISGAAVAWYGPEDKFKDKVTAQLFQAAERTEGGFTVALSYSGTLEDCAKHKCNATERLIEELTYASQQYFASPAYLKVNGRPLLFFFDLEKFDIDWKQVRARVPGRPLFLFRNPSGFEHAESDGAYSWVEPGQAGAGDPAGLSYLAKFYAAARKHPAKLAVGSVYKGFDDSLASWGKGRRMDQQCGNTWLATWGEIARTFDTQHPLPLALVVTWNDYEEGTEIETGIEDCVTLQAKLEGQTLSWELTGNTAAVDHFAIYVDDGRQWRHVSDVAADARAMSLGAAPIKRAIVQAVGKAGIVNHAAEASF